MSSSGQDSLEAKLENLQQRTGKSLEEWIRDVLTARLEKQRKLLEVLNKEHGVGGADQPAQRQSKTPDARPVE